MTGDAAHPGPSYQALSDLTDELMAELEGVYRDIHAHPELSMQETRTAGLAAAWLRRHGYEVTEGVGVETMLTAAGVWLAAEKGGANRAP